MSARRRRGVPAAILIAAVALPFVITGNYSHNVMALLAVYALAALGLNLLVGVAGQISLAHGAFMSIGGYTTAYLTLKAGLPIWLGVPLGGVAAAMVGFLLGLPALRLQGHFLALATLSFGAAIPQIALKWDAVTGGTMGLSPAKFPSDRVAYWVILAVLAVLVWVAYNILRSRPGRALLALRDSEIAAQCMGVNLAWAKSGIFALSAFYAGIAGALATHLSGFISPVDFNLLVSFQLLAAIVVGGLASIPGSIYGAVLIGYLPFALSRTQGWGSVVEGFAIIGIAIFLPYGLSSIGRRIAALRQAMPPAAPAVGAAGVQHAAPPPRPATPLSASVGEGGKGGEVSAHPDWHYLADALEGHAKAPLLEVQEISVSFGGVGAVQDVSFSVGAGTIHGLIGPNGAGKTTMLNCISRLLAPSRGGIRFGQRDLLQVAPHDVVRLGIARTFQNLELCRSLSALDNVLLGLYHRVRVPALAFAVRLPPARRAEAECRREALELLVLVGCREVAGAIAQGLPHGVLKRVELARALACRPKLLVMDEPAAGLDSAEREALAALVRRVQSMGITVLLVEHDMPLVMSLCDRVTVLDFGRVIADGSPEHVQHNPAVIAAYLGVEEEERLASA